MVISFANKHPYLFGRHNAPSSPDQGRPRLGFGALEVRPAARSEEEGARGDGRVVDGFLGAVVSELATALSTVPKANYG